MKKSIKLQKKHKATIALLLVIAIVLSLFALARGHRLDESTPLLGMSLGDSGDGDFLLRNLLFDIDEEGELETNDLTLTLLLSDEVASVRMTPPPEEETLFLESSLVAHADKETKETAPVDDGELPRSMGSARSARSAMDSLDSRSVILGGSDPSLGHSEGSGSALDPSLGVSGQKQSDFSEDETTRTVAFAAPRAGVYTFELLDAQGQIMATTDHLVRGGAEQSSTIIGFGEVAPVITEKIALSLKASIVKSDKVQRWTVTLPPGMTVVNKPLDTAIYKVSLGKTFNVPAEEYAKYAGGETLANHLISNNIPLSQIYIEINKEQKTSINMVTEVWVDPSIAEINGLQLGQAMQAFIPNPEEMPLIFTSEVVDIGDTSKKHMTSTEVATKSQLLVRQGDGTLVETPQVLDTINLPKNNILIRSGSYTVNGVDYSYSRPQFRPSYHSSANPVDSLGLIVPKTVAGFGDWHYPYDKTAKYMFHILDGMEMSGSSPALDPNKWAVSVRSPYAKETLDGHDYAVQTSTNSSYINVNNPVSTTNLSGYVYFPPITELTPGDTYKFEAARGYYNYSKDPEGAVTYKELAEYQEYKIPEYRKMTGSSLLWNESTAQYAGGTTQLLRERKQDSLDRYLFRMTNAWTANMSAIYKDIDFTFSFPYEVSPERLELRRDSNADLQYSSVFRSTDIRNRMIPSTVGYTLYDDPSTTFYLELENASHYADGVFTFPAEHASKHIKDITLSYTGDKYIPETMIFSYEFFAKNAKENESGPLGQRFDTRIDLNVQGTMVKESGIPKSQGGSRTESLDFAISQPLVLVGKADGLRFGSFQYSNNYYNVYRGMTYNTTNNAFPISRNPLQSPTSWDELLYKWRFGMKTVFSNSQPYENVKIEIIAPTDPAVDNTKALSKISGLDFSGFYHNKQSYVKNPRLIYKTNTSTAEQTVNLVFAVENSSFFFDLEEGEYITALRLEFDEIRTEQIYAYPSTGDTGELLYLNTYPRTNSYEMLIITPVFDNYRTLFGGAEPVVPGEEYTLQAHMSTTTPAQYIGSGDGQNAVSTAKLSWEDTDEINVYYTVDNTKITTGTTSYAQGASFYATLSNTGAFGQKAATGYDSTLRPYFYSSGRTYTDTFYIEVDDYFILLGVGDETEASEGGGYGGEYTFTPVKHLERNGNKTTVYKVENTDAKFGSESYSYRRDIVYLKDTRFLHFRVRPNAPDITQTQAPTPFIYNVGFTLDEFENQYMVPQDSYFEEDPYYKLTITRANAENLFAPELGITDKYQYSKKMDEPISLSITYGTYSDIDLSPAIEGGAYGNNPAKAVSFWNHNREDLYLDAYLQNGEKAIMYNYNAYFRMPRKDRVVEGHPDKTSRYDLYLTGPITVEDTDDYTVRYYKLNDDQGTMDPIAAGWAWADVDNFQIHMNEIKPGGVHNVKFPVSLGDFEKLGKNTSDLPAYMEASFNSGGVAERTISQPAVFSYKSYALDFRLGYDKYDSGEFAEQLPRGYAEATVHYKNTEETGTLPAVLESGLIPVNHDITKLSVESKNPEYILTVANWTGADAKKSSKVPRSAATRAAFPESAKTGEIVFDTDTIKTQLIAGANKGTGSTQYQYDAHFIKMPKIITEEVNLAVDEEARLKDTITLPNNGLTYPTTYSIEDTTIAKLTTGKTGYGTGVKKGTTRYTVNVANGFNDVFTSIANLNVISKYASGVEITKTFPSGQSALDSSDVFTLSVWSDNANDKKTVSLSGEETKSFTGNIVELGVENTIEETNLSVGYRLQNIAITYKDTSNAVQTVAVTPAGTNAYTFTIRDVKATDVKIIVTNAWNKGAPGAVTLEKNILGGPLKEGDSFPITVKGPGLSPSGEAYSLVHGDTATPLPALIVGQTYYVSEDLTGNALVGYLLENMKINDTLMNKDTATNTYSFTAPAEGSHKVVVHNSKNTSGKIKLSKEMVTGQTPLADTDTFTVNVGGTNHTIGFATGAEITGLIPGQTYNIKETEIPVGYKFNSMSNKTGGATITPKADGSYDVTLPAVKNTVVEIAVVNEWDYVPADIVTLKKTMKAGESANPQDKNFLVDIWREGDAASIQTYTIAAEAPAISINHLVAGQKYYISEQSKNGYRLEEIAGSGIAIVQDINGYHFTAPASDATSSLEITVTNALSRGNVQIQKNISNHDAPINPLEKSFAFFIWPENTPKPVAPTHTVNFGQVLEITDLYGGQVYNIEEAIKTNYTFESFTGAVPTVGGEYQFTAPLSSEGSLSILANNTVNFVPDNIVTLEKNLAGTVLDPTDTFDVTISGLNQNKTYTLPVSGSAVEVTGLVAGETYTIEEADHAKVGYLKDYIGSSDGSILLTETSPNSGVYQFVAPAKTTTAPATITVYNKNAVLPSGVVAVEKAMKSGETANPHSKDFEVEIWWHGDTTRKTYSITASDIAGGTGPAVPVPHLIAGEKYYINEKDKDGYRLDRMETNGPAIQKDDGGFFFMAPESAEVSLTITVVNTLSRGSVQLSKVISNSPGLVDDTSPFFEFYIWPANETEPAEPTHRVAFGDSLHITELFGGQVYNIKEKAKTNYTFESFAGATQHAGSVYQFTMPTTNTSSLSIQAINSANLLGDTMIQLEKSLAGNVLDIEDIFTVVLYGANQNGRTYHLPVGGTPVNATGLVAGETYTIEEIDHAKAGYLKDYIGSSDGSIALTETAPSSGRYTFTAPALTATTPVTITAYNKNHILNSGTVQLEKTMRAGETANPLDKEFSVNIWWEKDAPSTTPYTITAGGSAVPVTGLMAGEKYYIEEEIKTGYTLDSIQSRGITVGKEGERHYFIAPDSDLVAPRTITVTNALSRGSVQIQKTISNHSGAVDPTDADFEFIVWPEGTPQPSAATHKVTFGEVLTLSDLYGGQKYFIEEVAKKNYTFESIRGASLVSGETYEFIAPLGNDPSLAIQVSNRVNFVPDNMLLLEKNLTGEALHAGDSFEVVVNGLNQNNQRYTLSADGTGVFANGLVADEKYTIEEITHSNKGYLKESIGSSDGSMALVEKTAGSGVYEFIAPALDTTAPGTITAYNKHHVLKDTTVTLEKHLAKGQHPIDPTDTFSFKIWRAGTTKPVSPNSTATVGASVKLPGLIADQRYYIEEQGLLYYRQDSITINGAPLEKDNIGYYFTAPEEESKPLTIVVTNALDYLPEGTIGIIKEMGYDKDNNHQKPLANDEKFQFYVWRDGTEVPSQANYEAIVYRSKPQPLKNIIAGAKYYIEEEYKAGYLFNTFSLNGKALQKDSGGYYFIAPKTAEDILVITAENILDDLPDGTLFLEKVMAEYQKPIGEFQRFYVSVKPADRSSASGVERYTLVVNGDRKEMVNLTAGGRYYVVEEDSRGYALDKVLYDGEEMERDDTGYFFTAPISGQPGVITVVNRLDDGSDGTMALTKYIDGKPGGSPELPKEEFTVELTGPKNLKATAVIDSATGEVTWKTLPAKWVEGTYKIREILPKDSAYTYSRTSLFVNDEKVKKGDSFQWKEGDTVDIHLYNLYRKGGGKEAPKDLMIPAAGGFPMEALGVAGVALILAGAVLYLIYRKKRFDNK